MKNAKIRLRLVLYHEYPLSLESGIKPIKDQKISSLSDRKILIKIFCICCALPIAPFPQNDSDFWSYQKLEQDLMIFKYKKISLQILRFLGYIMR